MHLCFSDQLEQAILDTENRGASSAALRRLRQITAADPLILSGKGCWDDNNELCFICGERAVPDTDQPIVLEIRGPHVRRRGVCYGRDCLTVLLSYCPSGTRVFDFAIKTTEGFPAKWLSLKTGEFLTTQLVVADIQESQEDD